MKEIELSSMVPVEALDLQTFEQQTLIRANAQQLKWDSAWQNILQIGLYQRGPDLSEVGSTWLDNLKDMRALRPFSATERHQLGGDTAFLSNSWSQEITTPGAGTNSVISIPWILDTRLFYYRRDLLAQAGIPEQEAFATPEAVYATLRRLQEAGIPYPLALPTGGLSIHNLASWVWGRGGRFRSHDYRKIALVEPEARQGMADFFQLHRFIDPASRGSDYRTTHERFYQGQAAVMLSGQWSMRTIKNGEGGVLPDVAANTGYVMPPGVPFVGAAHLVIWRHSLRDREAVQVIEHLTSLPTLRRIFTATGNFPARLAALNAPPFSDDPDYALIVKCLRQGRMIRSARLWAGVEVRVNALCDQLWEDLFANSTLDLTTEINRRVRDLASRLEKTLLADY